MTPTIQTDGVGGNTRDGKSTSNSGQKTRYTSPTQQHTKKARNKTQQNYPFDGKKIWCHVFSSKHQKTRMKFKCPKCNVGLCAIQCLEVHHIILNF